MTEDVFKTQPTEELNLPLTFTKKVQKTLASLNPGEGFTVTEADGVKAHYARSKVYSEARKLKIKIGTVLVGNEDRSRFNLSVWRKGGGFKF